MKAENYLLKLTLKPILFFWQLIVYFLEIWFLECQMHIVCKLNQWKEAICTSKYMNKYRSLTFTETEAH